MAGSHGTGFRTVIKVATVKVTSTIAGLGGQTLKITNAGDGVALVLVAMVFITLVPFIVTGTVLVPTCGGIMDIASTATVNLLIVLVGNTKQI
jgi:hypothetical protein